MPTTSAANAKLPTNLIIFDVKAVDVGLVSKSASQASFVAGALLLTLQAVCHRLHGIL
jgi:hypothetical protein